MFLWSLFNTSSKKAVIFTYVVVNSVLKMYYIYIKCSIGPTSNLFLTDAGQLKFSICHWNLQSLLLDSFLKVSIVGAYPAISTSHINCISETFLNFSTQAVGGNLDLPGYNLMKTDNQFNAKESCVCISFQQFPTPKNFRYSGFARVH